MFNEVFEDITIDNSLYQLAVMSNPVYNAIVDIDDTQLAQCQLVNDLGHQIASLKVC